MSEIIIDSELGFGEPSWLLDDANEERLSGELAAAGVNGCTGCICETVTTAAGSRVLCTVVVDHVLAQDERSTIEGVFAAHEAVTVEEQITAAIEEQKAAGRALTAEIKAGGFLHNGLTFDGSDEYAFKMVGLLLDELLAESDGGPGFISAEDPIPWRAIDEQFYVITSRQQLVDFYRACKTFRRDCEVGEVRYFMALDAAANEVGATAGDIYAVVDTRVI